MFFMLYRPVSSEAWSDWFWGRNCCHGLSLLLTVYSIRICLWYWHRWMRIILSWHPVQLLFAWLVRRWRPVTENWWHHRRNWCALQHRQQDERFCWNMWDLSGIIWNSRPRLPWEIFSVTRNVSLWLYLASVAVQLLWSLLLDWQTLSAGLHTDSMMSCSTMTWPWHWMTMQMRRIWMNCMIS